MATPAEILAANKPRQRAPRNKVQRVAKVECRCRVLRERLKLSLRDVAEATGLSVSGLFAVEHGGDVQMTTALRLCEFYGRKLSQLWLAKGGE